MLVSTLIYLLSKLYSLDIAIIFALRFPEFMTLKERGRELQNFFFLSFFFYFMQLAFVRCASSNLAIIELNMVLRLHIMS